MVQNFKADLKREQAAHHATRMQSDELRAELAKAMALAAELRAEISAGGRHIDKLRSERDDAVKLASDLRCELDTVSAKASELTSDRAKIMFDASNAKREAGVKIAKLERKLAAAEKEIEAISTSFEAVKSSKPKVRKVEVVKEVPVYCVGAGVAAGLSGTNSDKIAALEAVNEALSKRLEDAGLGSDVVM